MGDLFLIHEQVRHRTQAIAAAHGDWPCQKGCDDCCRRLASTPRLTAEEWRQVNAALNELPPAILASVKERIAALPGALRPITCPMLDLASGSCLIYGARPVACRTYGFYVDRDGVLGCSRIEQVSQVCDSVMWGNHEGVESRLRSLGPAHELTFWLFSKDSNIENLATAGENQR